MTKTTYKECTRTSGSGGLGYDGRAEAWWQAAVAAAAESAQPSLQAGGRGSTGDDGIFGNFTLW